MLWWVNYILRRLEKGSVFFRDVRTQEGRSILWDGSGPGKVRISENPYLAGLNGLGDA